MKVPPLSLIKKCELFFDVRNCIKKVALTQLGIEDLSPVIFNK